MSIFDAQAKAAARAYFAREPQLVERLLAHPDDAQATLDLCRLQVPLERPIKLLSRLTSPAIHESLDPDVHRQACELSLAIGAFGEAKAHADQGLTLAPGSEALTTLLQRARQGLAQDEADGVTPQLKRIYLTGLQRLVHGQAAWAAEHFSQIVAAAPRFIPAWIGLRGALEAQGLSSSSVLDQWIAASPETSGEALIVMGRRLGANGLLFDRRGQLPLVGLHQSLTVVSTLPALEASKASVLLLDPGGEEVTLDPGIDRNVDRIVLSYTTPEVFLAAIDNAALVGRGAIVDADGVLVRELHHPTLKKYGMAEDGRQVGFDRVAFPSWLGSVKVYDTPALLMAGPTDKSFGDWMLSFMPRLAIAKAAALSCPIVVSAHAAPPFYKLLREAGVRRDDIILHDPGGISLFRKLYVPSWPMREFLRPMAGLFETLQSMALPPAPGPGRRLYLSRERIGRRSMLNEAEVREVFERHGLEVVHPQDVSLEALRELLSEADYVGATYGSALLNLAMASRKPKVIICAPPLKLGFLKQAVLWMGAMGLKLAYVIGEPVGELGRHGIKDVSWRARLDEVERALLETLKPGC